MVQSSVARSKLVERLEASYEHAISPAAVVSSCSVSSGGCSADADFAGGADAGLRAETVPSRHRDGRLRQLAGDARASYKRAPVTMRRATVEQRLELDKDNSAWAHAATMNAMRKMECQFGRAAASAAGESWKHADKL